MPINKKKVDNINNNDEYSDMNTETDTEMGEFVPFGQFEEVVKMAGGKIKEKNTELIKKENEIDILKETIDTLYKNIKNIKSKTEKHKKKTKTNPSNIENIIKKYLSDEIDTNVLSTLESSKNELKEYYDSLIKNI